MNEKTKFIKFYLKYFGIFFLLILLMKLEDLDLDAYTFCISDGHDSTVHNVYKLDTLII